MEIPVRDAIEIQRAHDLLLPLITGELPEQVLAKIKIDDSQKTLIMAAADVLCWVLKHDHNTSFGKNIEKLEAGLKSIGLSLDTEPRI